MINNGYKNEIAFVEYFNNKYYSELDQNSREMLDEIFDGRIDDSEPLIVWKNKELQKADIFIKFKNYVKGISIKIGQNNSVHCENMHIFENFLKTLNIPYYAIDYYTSFHYGYARDENGKRITSKKLGAFEYLEMFKGEIDVFNRYINKTRIIINMVERFIIRGRNSNYDIDALISGSPEDYAWISKDDLYDLFLSMRKTINTTPHVSRLTFGPKKRCLTTNYRKDFIYSIAVKWKDPKKDIIEFKTYFKNKEL